MEDVSRLFKILAIYLFLISSSFGQMDPKIALCEIKSSRRMYKEFVSIFQKMHPLKINESNALKYINTHLESNADPILTYLKSRNSELPPSIRVKFEVINKTQVDLTLANIISEKIIQEGKIYRKQKSIPVKLEIDQFYFMDLYKSNLLFSPFEKISRLSGKVSYLTSLLFYSNISTLNRKFILQETDKEYGSIPEILDDYVLELMKLKTEQKLSEVDITRILVGLSYKFSITEDENLISLEKNPYTKLLIEVFTPLVASNALKTSKKLRHNFIDSLDLLSSRIIEFSDISEVIEGLKKIQRSEKTDHSDKKFAMQYRAMILSLLSHPEIFLVQKNNFKIVKEELVQEISSLFKEYKLNINLKPLSLMCSRLVYSQE
ncbi:MAG: hypothetical protein H6622_10055 [Halobacteriovoraceae bacterium]|nr:hypothetical protein [Halobacteriovoraceae bacterium]